MTQHARLSPSDHAWVHCPGKIREASGYVDVISPAAIDGTGSHELLERCLVEGKRAEEFIGDTVGVGHEDMPMGWFVDIMRAERVQLCLDYVQRRITELSDEFPNATVHVTAEERVNPGKFCNPPREDWRGTADITIEVLNSEGKQEYLEVVDYKDGRIFVNAEENTQLQSYWIGRAYETDCTLTWRSRMTIVQPKTNPPIRYTEDKDRNQLHLAYQRLSRAAGATDDPLAPLKAGDWCYWCLANPRRGGHCTQPVDQSTQEVSTMLNVEGGSSILDALRNSKVEDMSAEDLAKLADQEPLFQAAFDRVKAEISERVKQGLQVPGWGMVRGNGRRKWKDEEAAAEALKNRRLKAAQYRPRVLISPAQAEKLLGKEVFRRLEEDHVEVIYGDPKVGRVAGNRGDDIETMFMGVDPSAPGAEETVVAEATPGNPTSISFL